MQKNKRQRIIAPARCVRVIASGSVAGREEHRGPLGDTFDFHDATDDRFGMSTWEKAESEMQRLAMQSALKGARLDDGELDYLLAGDLMNQCVGSNYGLLTFGVPYLGLYGACSTMAEGMLLGSLLVGGAERRCGVATSSHNCTAERQFRFPVEYGGQRPPTAQWTATAAGAVILSSVPEDEGRLHGSFEIRITETLAGEAIDAGITDMGNMGAAMAPAAADTLERYFRESGREPESFDLIVTGDLGAEGSGILCDLLFSHGFLIAPRHADCGLLLYDRERQDKHAGGSGCGCSAVVMASHVLRNMAEGVYRDVLFVGTGALMNPMTVQQGLSIPGIGHLVHLEAVRRTKGGEA